MFNTASSGSDSKDKRATRDRNQGLNDSGRLGTAES